MKLPSLFPSLYCGLETSVRCLVYSYLRERDLTESRSSFSQVTTAYVRSRSSFSQVTTAYVRSRSSFSQVTTAYVRPLKHHFTATSSSPLKIMQILFNKKLYEEVISFYPLLRHGPFRKHSVRQFLSCCVHFHCRWNVFYRAVA
jgi:hypothetical protein